jgi:large subunit ribosomal protein L32
MAQPKRKTSKMKKRQRKAANFFVATQVAECTNCGAPARPHHACAECGFYGGKSVIAVETAE